MNGSEASYRLTDAAEADLEAIWRYGHERWSAVQADRYLDDLDERFRLLGTMPMMTRKRTEFDPPIRIHPFGSHLVIYVVAEDGIDILRVLGNRQDWRLLYGTIDADT